MDWVSTLLYWIVTATIFVAVAYQLYKILPLSVTERLKKLFLKKEVNQ